MVSNALRELQSTQTYVYVCDVRGVCVHVKVYEFFALSLSILCILPNTYGTDHAHTHIHRCSKNSPTTETVLKTVSYRDSVL